MKPPIPGRTFLQIRSLLFCAAILGVLFEGYGKQEDISFEIPSGEAVDTLRLVARQGSVDILFAVKTVKGVRTHAVSGLYTPQGALDLMLENTSLKTVLDSASGAYAISRKAIGGSNFSDRAQGQRRRESTLESQSKKQKRNKNLLKSLIALTRSGSASTHGQVDSDGDKIIELSPFEVAGGNDNGYRANNTLAGTRTKTSLKNVAAAVSVFTEEFIADTGATDINDLFAFLPSAEGTKSYSPGGGDPNGWAAASKAGLSLAGVSQGSLQELGADRVRGLENATIARDFFETNIPLDTYNISRAALNRGPNSILFGLGKSSGTLNYTLKKAIIGENANSVTVRIGNEKAFRTSFDFNRVLYSGENGTGLAVRLNGLYEEGGYRQTNVSYNVDRRVFAALTWKPTEKTSIYANIEKSNRRLSIPTDIGVVDGITEWVKAGMPTWDPSVGGSLPAGLTDATNGSLRTGIYGFFDADTWEAGRPEYAIQSLHVNSNSPGLDNGNDYIFARPRYVKEGQRFGGNASFRPEVLNGVLKRVNTDPSSRYRYNDEAYNITLQHNFLNQVQAFGGRNSLNAQIQVFREDAQRDNRSAFHEGFAISIDVNETIPTGRLNPDGTQEFRSNPNFLRPWSSARQYWNSEYYSERTADNLELSYEWQGEGKWINKLAFTGMLKESDRDQAPYMNVMVMKDRPVETLSSLAMHDHWDDFHGGPVMSGLLYLGPAVDPNDPFGTLKFGRQPESRGAYNWDNVIYYDDANRRFDNYTGGIEGFSTPILFGSRIRNEVESSAVVFSGMFLKDKLSLIYGVREDEITVWGSDAADRNRQNGSFLPSSFDLNRPGVTNSGTTSSAGAVFHVTNWLSLHYNEADNFVPEGLRTDIWGFEIPQPTGEGTDCGFSLNLLENKLNLKVNFYETSQANHTHNDSTQGARLSLLGFESYALYQQLVDQGKPNEFQYVKESWEPFGPYGFAGQDLGHLTGSDPFFATTTSFEAKGTEIELFYSPASNWQIIGNVTEQETFQGSIARKLNEWMNFREPYYRTLSNWNDVNNEYQRIHGDLTNAEIWRRNRDSLAAVQLNEGRVQDQLRKYAANLNTSYTFTEGKFSGLGIGGGIRWADKAVIGFGSTIGPDGELTLDNNQPYYGDDIFDLNLFFKFKTEIRGLDTSLQLNFDGLLEGGGVRPIAKDPSGEVLHYAYNAPKRVFLTTTINF